MERSPLVALRLAEEIVQLKSARSPPVGICMKATSVWRPYFIAGLYRVISGGAIFTGKAKFSNSSLRTSAAWSSCALFL